MWPHSLPPSQPLSYELMNVSELPSIDVTRSVKWVLPFNLAIFFVREVLGDNSRSSKSFTKCRS